MSYGPIFENVVFPLSEVVLGTSVRKKLAFLERSQWWSKADMRGYQERRLRDLIRHAYTQTDYYKTVFRDANVSPVDITSIDDLRKLPFLTKEIVKQQEANLRAVNYLDKSSAKFTSGSTGNPTRFWQSREDYSWQWAAHFRAWKWAGYSWGDRYVKISLNADRHLWRKRIQDILMNSMYLCVFQLNPKSIEGYVDDIISFQPRIIYGYSSALTVMARQMLSRGIKYKAKAVIATGDNLIPAFRRDIERAFGAKVYDDYGCGGEGLAIANQCPAGNYHINEETVIVENNESGEVAITSLNNYAMPLIRYEIGDRIRRDQDACSCGRGLGVIMSIDGRSEDVVRTPNGDVLVVHFFTILFEYLQGVDQFKVVQEGLNGITIKLTVNNTYDKRRDELRIREHIGKSVGPAFVVEIDYVPEIPLEPNGKFRLIQGMRNAAAT